MPLVPLATARNDKTPCSLLINKISHITKIDIIVRQTARAPDIAYSLIGICDVTLVVAYGEGRKAFSRLRRVFCRGMTIVRFSFGRIDLPYTILPSQRLPDAMIRECREVFRRRPALCLDEPWHASHPSPSSGRTCQRRRVEKGGVLRVPFFRVSNERHRSCKTLQSPADRNSRVESGLLEGF
ncbi:hypothetical protein F5I97DRAFT_815611 [Phlebopus sp. FC_14]|nr:hypothetical protein F5I97DRAFT_815611 [Phlebopus sp. FC_14]